VKKIRLGGMVGGEFSQNECSIWMVWIDDKLNVFFSLNL
jgi:hypothetical protein